MNCKPDELCVIVRAPDECICNLGAFVTVVEIDHEGEWIFRDASRPLKMLPSENCDDKSVVWVRDGRSGVLPDGHYCTLSDADLLPIRPGDITDEEVRELYAPKQPEVLGA